MSQPETVGFLRPKPQKGVVQTGGCCHSKHTWNCCIATAIIGALFIILGIIVVVAGKGLIESRVTASMALEEGSERTESWLRPPVTPHLTAYAWHVTNPNAVLAGKKPILEERGPFVYKVVVVKDSDDNMVWDPEHGKLTYRPRRIYTYVPEMSDNRDPDNEFVTVPNIPMWTGLNGLRSKSGAARDIGLGIVLENGRGTPFINVSFSGLLWGYEDELPCLKLDYPAGCSQGSSPFSSGGFAEDDGGDDFFGGGDDEDEFGDWKRKKRSLPEVDESQSVWAGLAKPKAEFINCTCNWGLFRDRNVTLRKPVEFLTGVEDILRKGIVTKFDNSETLNWWREGSVCDKVKGYDGSTFPPLIQKDHEMEVFIALMCRTIKLKFEKETTHADIRSLRFIPPPNALGSHDDPDPALRNPDNECYCLEDQGFRCFKSGVYNMEPCKRDTNAPLALSYPHFYQADPSFRDAVGGMNPEKEKHQFYVDVVPEFGFPLAIRPRFQLNIVIGKTEGYAASANLPESIVLPFLWAEDGFSEPSAPMAEKIRFGLSAPEKLSLLGSVVLFAIGGLMFVVALSYFVWQHRVRARQQTDNVVPT